MARAEAAARAPADMVRAAAVWLAVVTVVAAAVQREV
jgi:hypothetical protein